MRAQGHSGSTPKVNIFPQSCVDIRTSWVPSSRSPAATPYTGLSRPPYLSPPMSGASSPDSRLNPSRGTRRRRRSSSPISRPSAQVTTSSSGYPIRSITDVLDHDAGRETSRSTMPPTVGSTAPETFRPEPKLGAPLSISQPTMLSARARRRSKTHVASACVNCKQKHLGCDVTRPCRRCVSSGKEATCRDVEHKRRGRPPLRAEEGPLRNYETRFPQPVPVAPRIASQAQPPPAVPVHRPLATRELRPMPHLLPFPAGPDRGVVYSKPWMHTTNSPHSSLHLVPALSPPMNYLAAPPAASGYWQTTDSFTPSRGNSFTIRPDVAQPGPSRRMSDSAPVGNRYYTGQYPSYPYPYQGEISHRRPLYEESTQQTQRPSTTGGICASQVKLPSISECQLPPIRPGPFSNSGQLPQIAPATQNIAPPTWSRQEQHPPFEFSADPSANIDAYHTQPQHTQFRNPFLPNSENRTSTNPQHPRPTLLSSPPPSTNYPANPVRPYVSSPTQPIELPTREQATGSHTEYRPAKRQRMELGEMVNE